MPCIPQIDKFFASVNTIAVHGPIEYQALA